MANFPENWCFGVLPEPRNFPENWCFWILPEPRNFPENWCFWILPEPRNFPANWYFGTTTQPRPLAKSFQHVHRLATYTLHLLKIQEVDSTATFGRITRIAMPDLGVPEFSDKGCSSKKWALRSETTYL